jgi:Ssp1 endopeptidase immunity protein Rap1a
MQEMSKLSLALIVTCLISTASVGAQQDDLSFDTFRLISWCRQPDGTHNRGFCLGYVHAMAAAIANGLMAVKAGDKVQVLEDPLPVDQHVVCISDKVRAGQVTGVFLLFTDKHPELLHLHPSILVAQAVAEAFPCPAR